MAHLEISFQNPFSSGNYFYKIEYILKVALALRYIYILCSNCVHTHTFEHSITKSSIFLSSPSFAQAGFLYAGFPSQFQIAITSRVEKYTLSIKFWQSGVFCLIVHAHCTGQLYFKKVNFKIWFM